MAVLISRPTTAPRAKFLRDRNLIWMGFVLIVCISIFRVSHLHSETLNLISNNGADVVDHPLISTTIEALGEGKERKGKERRGEERKEQDMARLERDPIPVFYNLFVGDESSASRVMDIVSEQKAFFQPYHKPFFIQSIGAVQLNISNATMLGHRPKGDEVITLRSLWNFCRNNKQVEKVVYLHPKGSFHDHPRNRDLRKFITAGALSEECASIDETCNVCSSRFSPVPHPHTSGNMWLARCDYVRQLIDPFDFEQEMNSFKSSCTEFERDDAACDGRGRFSAEHWVHSHPSVKPCDLHKNPEFVWGYSGLPQNGTLEIEFALAPRFDLVQYIFNNEKACPLRGLFLDHRLYEYWQLYGMKPDESWWGWNYLQTNRTFLLEEKRFDKWSGKKECWQMTTKNGTVVRTNH